MLLLAQAKILYVIIMGEMFWSASAVKLAIVLIVWVSLFQDNILTGCAPCPPKRV